MDLGLNRGSQEMGEKRTHKTDPTKWREFFAKSLA